jgi:hypothetical protein
MFTIFSPMRPFHSDIGVVQINAIRSWLALPDSEVIIVDDEEGTTTEATHHLPVTVVADVQRSRLGAPLLGDLLCVGAAHARHDMLAYITADVLLPPNTAEVIQRCRQLMDGKPFLAVAGRFDLLQPVSIPFDEEDWFESVKSAVRLHGRAHGHTAIDLWVYPRDLDLAAPPFPIGRGGTDGWVVWDMKRRSIPVIDLSPELMMVHQFHSKPARKSPLFHEELIECVDLFPTMARDAMTLLDADLVMSGGVLRQPVGLRRLHAAMSFFGPYRALIGLRRRLGLPHIYGPASRAPRSG